MSGPDPAPEGCTRFERLGDYGRQVKEELKESRGLSPKEYIRMMRSIT